MRKLIADCVKVIKKRLNMAAVKSRLRNNAKLKIGIRLLSSTNTNTAHATAERANVAATVGWRQPICGNWFMA